MSDIVLGAIIGFAAAALGSIITGIFNYKNSESQIQARRDELSQQLSHQEQETGRDRLIEARKDTLLGLRNTISEWVSCSQGEVTIITRLKEALTNKERSPDWKPELRELMKISEHMQQLSSQLDMLRGQVSDNTLDNLIEAVKETDYEVSIQRMPLLRFFNEPGSADINIIESAWRKDQSLLKEVRNKVLRVNKRIEELLSGEPSD